VPPAGPFAAGTGCCRIRHRRTPCPASGCTTTAGWWAEPDWFGDPGPARHPGLARLVGEVELPHVTVTMNKSDVDRDSEEWLAVEVRLHRSLAPVVRRLTRDEGPAASPQALRTAEQVRRILARALRLLEQGRLFESEVAGARVRDGQLALDDVPAAVPGEPGPAADETDDQEQRDPDGSPPATPAPPGRGTRTGVGEVAIRALDPRIRSALVLEEGVRRVIINSRYPLFEVRKGDLWYQLETALREVCVTIPEATVPEFERRVNDLMLVSLALAARHRRRTAPGTRQLRAGLSATADG
jgi:hypothetical protein